MPDDQPRSSHVSLRVPNEVIAAFDRLAVLLERPRSWVMVRALRRYLAEEGAEIFEDVESIAELDRGEAAPFEDTLRRVREIVEKAEREPASNK
jgi:predicted transcriptional regulator